MNDMEVTGLRVFSRDKHVLLQNNLGPLSVKVVGDRICIKAGNLILFDLPQEHTIIEYFYDDEKLDKIDNKNYREIMKEKVRQAKERILKK
jgi:hypothetical protein